jgi:hypothetical protein
MPPCGEVAQAFGDQLAMLIQVLDALGSTVTGLPSM